MAAPNPNLVNPCTVLVKVDFVTALLGKPVDDVFAMVDGASLTDAGLQWVWNIATNPKGKMRNLRFWVKEMSEPKSLAGLTLEEAIDRMLPITREEYFSGQVCSMFQIRRPTLHLLRKQLGVEQRKGARYFPRVSLAAFLRARWCGADAAQRSQNP